MEQKKRSKIAIFGGSFNPIHLAHVNFCLFCKRNYNFNKIILIPTNIPPHKSAKEFACGKDRYEMTRLAVEEYSDFEVSDFEIKKGGISYTVDTIAAFKVLYPDSDLYLLMGSDMFISFEKWKDYNKILNDVTIVVGARTVSDEEKLAKKIKCFEEYKNKIEILKYDIFELSSTQIRDLLKKGNAVKSLNKKVNDYIVKHNLYLDK